MGLLYSLTACFQAQYPASLPTNAMSSLCLLQMMSYNETRLKEGGKAHWFNICQHINIYLFLFIYYNSRMRGSNMPSNTFFVIIIKCPHLQLWINTCYCCVQMSGLTTTVSTWCQRRPQLSQVHFLQKHLLIRLIWLRYHFTSGIPPWGGFLWWLSGKRICL